MAMNAHHHSPLNPFGGSEDALSHPLPGKVGLALQRLQATAGDASLSVATQGEVTVLASVFFPQAIKTCPGGGLKEGGDLSSAKLGLVSGRARVSLKHL